MGERRAAAERRDADDMADAVGHEGLRGGPGETAVGVLRGQRRVRGDQPEHGVRALEGAVDDLGVTVRAGDHLYTVAHRVGQPGGVTYDHA